jgi:hypothetical protein
MLLDLDVPLQSGPRFNINVTLAFCVAFAFKILAALITIYTVGGHLATEIAPASAFLTSCFGVVSASIVANLIWIGATACSFFLMNKIIPDGRIKEYTLRISILIVVIVAAIDGLWDLGVLMNFDLVYAFSIIVLSLTIALIYTLSRSEKVIGRLSF